jgi:hypothetical protein
MILIRYPLAEYKYLVIRKNLHRMPMIRQIAKEVKVRFIARRIKSLLKTSLVIRQLSTNSPAYSSPTGEAVKMNHKYFAIYKIQMQATAVQIINNIISINVPASFRKYSRIFAALILNGL